LFVEDLTLITGDRQPVLLSDNYFSIQLKFKEKNSSMTFID